MSEGSRLRAEISSSTKQRRGCKRGQLPRKGFPAQHHLQPRVEGARLGGHWAQRVVRSPGAIRRPPFLSSLCVSLCVTLGRSVSLGLCSFSVKQRVLLEGSQRSFTAQKSNVCTQIKQCPAVKIEGFECVLNIGRNPEHTNVRREETRGALWSPQPSVRSGARAAEGVGGQRKSQGREGLPV